MTPRQIKEWEQRTAADRLAFLAALPDLASTAHLLEEIHQLRAAAEKFVKLHGKLWDWVQHLAWTERAVNALQVEPEGMGPIQIAGEDFTITCHWTDFKVCSPNSDFQLADPHYTCYSAQSPTAARTLYKKLRADPNALKNVSWNKLADWLAKNGVSFKTNFSRWS